jgi:hypothetical protein
MRLINCKSFLMEEFFGSNIPAYAILSHTWADEEVSFLEFTTDLEAARLKAGFRKIGFTCRQAIVDGLDYAWVDTSCINKSSSAELSEAINSMFTWYKNASICYAYLSDVAKLQFPEQFLKSRWFQRGWTLQELIAPETVDFYDQAWSRLGSRMSLASLIHEATLIDIDVLTDGVGTYGLGYHCIAKRMAWASHRQTTRVEDIAYCLLGIFNVNMPLLYGEGKKAFLRLQQEIIKIVDDDSILAWGRQTSALDFDILADNDDSSTTNWLFASSPEDFGGCHNITYSVNSISPFTLTNQGLNIELPLIKIVPSTEDGEHHVQKYSVGLLSCKSSDKPALLGILLANSVGSNIIKHRVALHADHLRTGVPAMTLLVGPRLVAHAIASKVIVANLAEGSVARGSFIPEEQIIVDQSRQLQIFDYTITGAKSVLIGTQHYIEITTSWDAETSILTIHHGPSTSRQWALSIFNFESNNEDSKRSGFSVLVRNGNAIIRKGQSHSVKELRKWYNHLEFNDEYDDKYEDVMFEQYNERPWIFSVATGDLIKVVNWEVRTISVDATDVTGLNEVDVLAKRCRRRATIHERC